MDAVIGGTDGANPEQGNLLYMNGTLYGTTPNGGNYGCYSSEGCGTVYSITTSGSEKVLHTFGSSGEGASPRWGLIDVNGTMYGTTAGGGSHGFGTVYSISAGGTEKVLYSFTGGSDSAAPQGLVDVKGMLYGTTFGDRYCGGTTPECGTVYSITTTGTEKVLYSFQGGSDGQNPGPLIDVNGTLYGTTARGGGGKGCYYGCGTVFSVTTTGTEKVLYSLNAKTDGLQPDAPLIDVNGTLYSTTYEGGAYGWGTVFALSP